MSRRTSLNISMPAELAAYVTGLVSSGRYGTASEVIRAGLRLLQEKEGGLPEAPAVEDSGKAKQEAR